MRSTFSWLDYSERDRRSMLDVIRLFQEKDTRDELGIGNIRDAFADLLFPGTSTIQTRARYLLFVPWMYQQLEIQRVRSTDIATVARRYELSLIEALMSTTDTIGVIGAVARSGLKRLPSNIYWQGLGRLRIRLFEGSQDQYQRSLDAFYKATGSRRTSVDEGEALEHPVLKNWHSGLPPVPEHFPKQATFKLTWEEASYLRERIRVSAPDSLFALLVDQSWEPEDVDAPWEHSRYSEFPRVVQTQLDHARYFGEIIYGAALLYNLMLAEKGKHGTGEEWRAKYVGALAIWAREIEIRKAALMDWDRTEFWRVIDAQPSLVGAATRSFVDDWIDLVLAPGGASVIASNASARALIHARERALKRGLARLDNPRALELWTGEAGTKPLRYRWPTAAQFVNDILSGLGMAHA